MSEETKVILDYLKKEIEDTKKWEEFHKKELIRKLNEDDVANDEEIARYIESRDLYRTVAAMADAIEDEIRMKNRK